MGTEGIPATRHAHGLRTLDLRVTPAAPEPRHPPEQSGSDHGDLHSGARRGRPVCATSLVVALSWKIKTFQQEEARGDHFFSRFLCQGASCPYVRQRFRSIDKKTEPIRMMRGNNLFTASTTAISPISPGGLSSLVYDSRLGSINRCWDPGRLPG